MLTIGINIETVLPDFFTFKVISYTHAHLVSGDIVNSHMDCIITVCN